MAKTQGHRANLGWIAPQRNASTHISMVVLPREIGNKRALQHDPEKWEPVSEKIMLKQEDNARVLIQHAVELEL
jgi:hypothetical protein